MNIKHLYYEDEEKENQKKKHNPVLDRIIFWGEILICLFFFVGGLAFIYWGIGFLFIHKGRENLIGDVMEILMGIGACGVGYSLLRLIVCYFKYNKESITVKTLFHTRTVEWKDLSWYIKLDLLYSGGHHITFTYKTYYLIAKNKEDIEKAYQSLVEERVDPMTEELDPLPLSVILHDREYRNFYALPATPAIEQLIQENNLTKYRKQWTGNSTN